MNLLVHFDYSISYSAFAAAQGPCSDLHFYSLNYAIFFNILMIFSEGTDVILNCLQTKDFAIFQKLWATEQKTHFLSNNLIYIYMFLFYFKVYYFDHLINLETLLSYEV